MRMTGAEKQISDLSATSRSMIDVLHPNAVSINHHMTQNNSLRGKPQEEAGSESTITTSNHGNEEAEEQAWLDSITSTEAGSVTHIKPLQKGALVMDIGQLRESVSSSSSRKASKAGVGRM